MVLRNWVQIKSVKDITPKSGTNFDRRSEIKNPKVIQLGRRPVQQKLVIPPKFKHFEKRF